MAERAADMGATVRVAPREIHDLVYRASRIAGCDPGTAERIAENVTFAEIHYGAAVRALCETLEAADLPTSAWATAPDALLSAEIAARSNGTASTTFDPPVPLASIAASLQQSLERGVAPAGIDGRASGATTVGAIELHSVDPQAGAASRLRIDEARSDAHRLGIGIDQLWFSRLEAAAAGFLVAETTLDDLDG